MKKFRCFINESFNNPYPYSMKYSKSLNAYEAIAKLKDGSFLKVYIQKINQNWGISFARSSNDKGWWQSQGEHDMGITNTGDQMRVFATVLAIVKEFIKKESPKEIIFNAEKSQKDINQEVDLGSREKLYARMVKRFASKMGYKSKSERLKGETLFRLIKV